MAGRRPEEIRESIEQNRQALVISVERLRGEVAELTDWRRQIVRHRTAVMISAGVAGFLVGGGVAALGGRFGRRRRKQLH